jgi:hypothetical protein
LAHKPVRTSDLLIITPAHNATEIPKLMITECKQFVLPVLV